MEEREVLSQIQQQTNDLNLDEILTDFDWKVGGDASALEARLTNELIALEAANIHSIIQAEDQSIFIEEGINKAVVELDAIQEWLTLYSNELYVSNNFYFELINRVRIWVKILGILRIRIRVFKCRVRTRNSSCLSCRKFL